MQDLKNKLPRALKLLDVGARGGLQRPWKTLSKLLSVTAVEADPVEAASLSGQMDKVVDLPLWQESTTVTFNITRSPGVASVFLPNRDLLNQFPEAERFDILRTENLRTTTVDSLGLESDFAKLDVQGAELAVLRGGQRCFQSLIGLEVEVEFAPIYEHQPLFAEVDMFIRNELGLELWDIRKTYWKYKKGVGQGATKGRLMFGDALYFAPLSKELSPDKAIMLVLSALAYGYVDYAATVLDRFEFDPGLRARLQATISGSPSRRFLRNGSWSLFLLFDTLAKQFRPTHNGWASTGEKLGSRRRGSFWT